MMFSGSRRRMFRNETPATKKPSLTRQAIGILASSRELMDEVQPVRMVAGGDVALEQERQRRLLQYLSSPISSVLTQPPSAQLRIPQVSNTGMGIGALPEVQKRGLSPDPATMTPREALVDPTLVVGNIRSRIMGTNTAERPDRARILREQEQVVPPKDASSFGIATLEALAEEPPLAESFEYAKQTKMPQPRLKELYGQRTSQRRSLKKAQNELGQAQRAYDKAVKGNRVGSTNEATIGVALSKLELARKKVAQENLELSELNKQLGKENMSKFVGKIENINRQLGDDNVSEGRKQELREELEEVQVQMEEAGLRKFEGDDTNTSDRPQKPVPPAKGEGEVTGEGAPDAQEEVLKKAQKTADANTTEAVKNSDISPKDQPTALKIIEQAERDLDEDSEGIADGTSTEEQDIVRRAMEMAEYDEQEIRDSLKRDSFWNAVMMFGLQMAAGASEGGDRFSNMARAAVIGLNEFNKDMKEKEKSAYARYRDKKADAFAEAGLELKRISSENQSRSLTNQLIMQKAQLANMRNDIAYQNERLELSKSGQKITVQGQRQNYVTDILKDSRAKREAEKRLRETAGYEKYAPTEKEKGGRSGQKVNPPIPASVLKDFLENEAATALPDPSGASNVIVLDQ